MANILIVDDDAGYRDLLGLVFDREGYSVKQIPDPRTVPQFLASAEPKVDLMVLDHLMPHMTGLRLAALLRQDPKTQWLPIIMLTGDRNTPDLESLAIRTVVDDFMRKPPEALVLLSRVAALLRRSQSGFAPQYVIEKGPCKLDVVAKTFAHNGKTIRLTPREFTILQVLMNREPGIVPRNILAELLWDSKSPTRIPAVDKAMERLRRRLGPAGRFITTRRKAGYAWDMS